MSKKNNDKSLKYYNSKDFRFGLNSFIPRLLGGHLKPMELLKLIHRTFRRDLRFRRLFRLEEKEKYKGLAVFVVRHNATELGVLDRIFRLIEMYGFEILITKNLNLEERQKLISATPIHKWAGLSTGRGHPEVCIVVFDKKPIYLYSQRTKMWLKFYPYLDNLRLVFKHSIRSRLAKTLDKSQRSCLIHATDNSKEAMEYVRITMPEKVNYIKNWVSSNLSRYLK